MKTALKLVLGLLVALVLLVVAVGLWAKTTSNAILATKFTAHDVDFPVPWPLSQAEVDALRQERIAALPPAAEAATEAVDPLDGVDLDALAMERALARGEHLMMSRYVCVECHGGDLGGGVMVDDPALGQLMGPNLTGGDGGPVASFTVSDWDRIVRHGIKHDGTPGLMPSEDFLLMSDQELSDIIAAIAARPDVARPTRPTVLGPVGMMLVATGEMGLAATRPGADATSHPQLPPAATVSVEFGKHLAGVCTGCHGAGLAGGPIKNGDPSWPPAANLTQHADGLAGWTFEQFDASVTKGVGADGTPLRYPMDMVAAYTTNMTPVERRALWAYVQTVPAAPTPQ